MNPPRKTELLQRALDGRLDVLTPAEVAALTELLNADDALARHVAASATAQRSWSAPSPVMPTSQEWARVWAGVSGELESAARSRALRSASAARAWRFRPVAAAAACVLMVSVLTRFRPAYAEPMMQLDRAAEYSSIEVSEDMSAFVVDSDDAGPMVWVVENDD